MKILGWLLRIVCFLLSLVFLALGFTTAVFLKGYLGALIIGPDWALSMALGLIVFGLGLNPIVWFLLKGKLKAFQVFLIGSAFTLVLAIFSGNTPTGRFVLYVITTIAGAKDTGDSFLAAAVDAGNANALYEDYITHRGDKSRNPEEMDRQLERAADGGEPNALALEVLYNAFGKAQFGSAEYTKNARYYCQFVNIPGGKGMGPNKVETVQKVAEGMGYRCPPENSVGPKSYDTPDSAANDIESSEYSS